MTPVEKQKLFEIRCRAMRGQEFHSQDYDFCIRMRLRYPQEYAIMTKKLEIVDAVTRRR